MNNQNVVTAFQFSRGSLGLPSQNNVFFNSSANIVPNWHVGPRMYNNAGFVPHPLGLTGGPVEGVFPYKEEPSAGALTTTPDGLDTTIAFPHFFNISGNQPG